MDVDIPNITSSSAVTAEGSGLGVHGRNLISRFNGISKSSLFFMALPLGSAVMQSLMMLAVMEWCCVPVVRVEGAVCLW